MMHGYEKSDSAILATKPPNKVGQPVAKAVERRAETKGNAGQQSTCRAQDRESVSQALGRVRQAARQRKKEKFTTLFHHISVETLSVAFSALKRKAAPGVDLSITHKWVRSTSFARRESHVILCQAPIRERCDGRGSYCVA
jgi:RNA-directed DNA polymerase